jgi:hypothetical protein
MSRTITCHGKQIAITENCESAIRTFRKRWSKRILWIDAICIDQAHVAERNHQVKLMAEIYSSASQVLAYLGPRVLNGVINYLDSDNHCHSGTTIIRDDLVAFLDLPYFNRVWVLQEVALAKLVVLVFGGRAIHWTSVTVAKLVEVCSILSLKPPSLLQWAPASQPERGDLLDVLRKCRYCSVSCHNTHCPNVY